MAKKVTSRNNENARKFSKYQLEAICDIQNYIRHYIDTNFDTKIDRFFIERSDKSKRSPYVKFVSGLTLGPDLPTLLRWMEMSDSHIDLIMEDGTVQRLAETVGTEGHFSELWRQTAFAPKSIKDISTDLHISDHTFMNYRKKFPTNFYSFSNLFERLNVKMVIVYDGPDVPSE